MSKLIGIIITCLIVLFIIFEIFKYCQIYKKSSQDGYQWSVVNFENSTEAAELFSKLDQNMRTFINCLQRKYKIGVDSEGGSVRATDVSDHAIAYRFVKKYNREMIEETDLRWTDDTSWTIAKGEKMYLCLRDKNNHKKLVDINTLVYVCLHEMAHVANPEWGHGKQFWKIFAFILSEAVSCGIYNPIDYVKYPVNYCGVVVNYQPLFDPTLH